MVATGILTAIALLIGYLWGKHDGMKFIMQRRIVKIPLLFRHQSFKKGYCLLCQQPKKNRSIQKIKKT